MHLKTEEPFSESTTTSEPQVAHTILSRHLARFLGDGHDPFDVRDPVFDVLNFFGREALAKSLEGRFRQSQPVGLFGFRKMGKTSLMRYLKNILPCPTASVD